MHLFHTTLSSQAPTMATIISSLKLCLRNCINFIISILPSINLEPKSLKLILDLSLLFHPQQYSKSHKIPRQYLPTPTLTFGQLFGWIILQEYRIHILQFHSHKILLLFSVTNLWKVNLLSSLLSVSNMGIHYPMLPLFDCSCLFFFFPCLNILG